MKVISENMKWGEVGVIEAVNENVGGYIFRFISESRDDVSCEIIGELEDVKDYLLREEENVNEGMFFIMSNSFVGETEEGLIFNGTHSPETIMKNKFKGSGHEIEQLLNDTDFYQHFKRCVSAASGRYGISFRDNEPHHADAVIYLNCSAPEVTPPEEVEAEDFDVEPVEGPYIEERDDRPKAEDMFNYPGVCQSIKKKNSRRRY